MLMITRDRESVDAALAIVELQKTEERCRDPSRRVSPEPAERTGRKGNRKLADPSLARGYNTHWFIRCKLHIREPESPSVHLHEQRESAFRPSGSGFSLPLPLRGSSVDLRAGFHRPQRKLHSSAYKSPDAHEMKRRAGGCANTLRNEPIH